MNTEASEFIDQLGGTSAVARICAGIRGEMTRQAVSRWRRDGIPASWRRALELEIEKGSLVCVNQNLPKDESNVPAQAA